MKIKTFINFTEEQLRLIANTYQVDRSRVPLELEEVEDTFPATRPARQHGVDPDLCENNENWMWSLNLPICSEYAGAVGTLASAIELCARVHCRRRGIDWVDVSWTGAHDCNHFPIITFTGPQCRVAAVAIGYFAGVDAAPLTAEGLQTAMAQFPAIFATPVGFP